MSGSTQKTTSSTAPSNKDVNPTVSMLLKGLQDEYKGGTDVFNKSLYPGVGATTKSGWAQTLGAAGNQDYANGIGGAIDSFGKVARGDYLDEKDPAFERDLSRTLDDTGADVNSFFGASGRLGGTPHVNDMVSSLGGIRDKALMGQRENSRNRQVQAASMLPSLFTSSLAPSAARGAVGSAQDADALATRQAENEFFRRKNDAGKDNLGWASSVLNGTAEAGGSTTTTTSPSTPWWQSLVGLGIGLM